MVNGTVVWYGVVWYGVLFPSVQSEINVSGDIYDRYSVSERYYDNFILETTNLAFARKKGCLDFVGSDFALFAKFPLHR